ncbi:MAG TPA: acyltransferase family protein [Solirubrobacterales bacterium]|jgi:peptidoglycan/LPS O-acetylase OafA/YrhL|nr:acyltransferase family protein [Solirubrobacterales bacterium]
MDSRTHPDQAEAGRRFRPDIEGLRAVAIVAVLLCHAGVGFLAGGYVGVDVFFVISGFLITRLLLGEMDRTGTISLRGFYARRAKRLLPLSAVLLATVGVLSMILLSPLRNTEVAGDIIASALYVANWHFAAQSVDYFAQGLEPSPVLHLWSLAIEEQFYLVWPGLMLIATWFWRRTGRSVRPVLWVVLTLILVGSFVYGIGLTDDKPAFAYFSTFARAWELGLGAALALAGAVRLPRLGAFALGWLGLAAIVYSSFVFTGETAFPGSAALVPTLGAAALILSGTALAETAGGVLGLRAGAGRLLSFAPIRYVGRISYSWYLWHWPFLVFAAAIWGPRLSVAAGLAAVAASWVPTQLTHMLIEDPVRRAPALRALPNRALALGLACTLVALGVGIGLRATQPTVRTARIGDVPGAAALPEQPTPQETAVALRPNPLKARADRGRSYYEGCMVGIEGTNSNKCLYGNPTGGRTLILFGDSHAMQYFPTVEELAEIHGWRLIVLTKAECPPEEIEVRSMIENREYSQCDEWREEAFKRIEEGGGKSVTVVMSGDTEYIPYGPEGEELTGDDAAEAMEAGYEHTLSRIEAAGQHAVVIRDNPTSVEDVPSCVSEDIQHLGRCAFPRKREWDREYDVRAAENSPETHLVDFIGDICPGEICRAVIGNALTYRDKDHLTATFARTLEPMLESDFREDGLM